MDPFAPPTTKEIAQRREDRVKNCAHDQMATSGNHKYTNLFKEEVFAIKRTCEECGYEAYAVQFKDKDGKLLREEVTENRIYYKPQKSLYRC